VTFAVIKTLVAYVIVLSTVYFVVQGTLVMVFKLSEARVPTVSSSIEKLELFSCNLRNEEETALSILDPVTVSVDLQPPGCSSHSSKSRTQPTKSNQSFSATTKLPTGQIVDVSFTSTLMVVCISCLLCAF